MVEFRAEPKTASNLTNIAETIDVSRSDLILSMVKFALTNHDWARFGLTHKTIPYYQGNPIMTTKKPTAKQIAARKKFADMARSGVFARKKARTANKMASKTPKKTISEKISQLVHEGYPQKQAVAVALSEQRAGKVKSNPTRTRKTSRSAVVQNPQARTAQSQSQSNYKYCVEAKRMIPGGYMFESIAAFNTKIQAQDYVDAILKSHKNVTLRIKTYK
jgi:hypothetical protein